MDSLRFVPAEPEEKGFTFWHGIRFEYSPDNYRLKILFEHIESEDKSLPKLSVMNADGSFRSFIFKERLGKICRFRSINPIGGSDYSAHKHRSYRMGFISTESWRIGVAAYYDFLAAKSKEMEAQESGQLQKYHLILDQATVEGERKKRRLIGSYFTRLGAEFALRQHSTWTQCKWEYFSTRDAFWEEAWVQEFDVIEELVTPAEVRVQMTTSYPYSRGYRAPLTMVWRWHLSRRVPLVEAVTAPPDDASDERDERWTHRPGNPKILRETGTGRFGSYPSFEGDDEPEHQDER